LGLARLPPYPPTCSSMHLDRGAGRRPFRSRSAFWPEWQCAASSSFLSLDRSALTDGSEDRRDDRSYADDHRSCRVVVWSPDTTQCDAFWQNPESLHFGSPAFIIASNRIWFIIITVVITAALAGLYRYTRFGRATRAAVDNQRATEGLGYSTQMLESVNWIIGGGLAAVAGVCLGTISPPTSTSVTGVLLVAIAIALLAKFQSFGIMLLAGVGVGAAQALATFQSAELQNATHLVGWSDALPLIVIIAAVLIGGRGIAAKEARAEPPFPDAPRIKHPMVSTGAVAVIVVGWILLIRIG